MVDKLSENNAYLKKERDGTAKLKTKLEAKASKGKLTPLECKQLSSCKTELLKVDARIKKFDNLQLKVCEMHAEISDRGHARLGQALDGCLACLNPPYSHLAFYFQCFQYSSKKD